VFIHCCGGVYEFIPDLIELGIDALNPVQVSAKNMDTKSLKEEFGDSLTFWGGIDTQNVLPFGTPQDVENEVKKRIADLAAGGGYVMTAVHNIQPDVRPENIVRMYESALELGKYPVTF
jgi:uroporphyrinogen decarboxylase